MYEVLYKQVIRSNIMNVHIKNIEQQHGCDCRHGSDLHSLPPENDRDRIGKSGYNKSLTLEALQDKAYNTNPRANIILKGGPRGKWYLKYCEINTIADRTRRTKVTKGFTMYVISWDDE